MDIITLYLIIAATSLIALSMLSLFGFKGFTAWIELKRAELDARQASTETGSTLTGNRIEIADLKERLRKLEAIAAGVDL